MGDSPSTGTPEASQRLGKYRLIAHLGSGGMARVFLGVVSGNGFNKLYVLKVLRSDVDAEQRVELLKMFRDEGRLAARLNHPHIVQSHEIGCEGGEHFIAMEYLEGQPLSRVQELWQVQGDCFPLALRLFVIGQLLDALDYAHRVDDYDGTPLEIVHRDVSPQNVFVTYAGHSKLLDFGIAKTQASRQTRAGVLKGKLPYMAPEQVKTLPLDQRTDIFSVGVMLWECIAGRLLFAGCPPFEMLTRLVTADIPRLRDVVADVPPLLDEIVARALALDPDERQPDARTLRAELLQFEALSRVSARDVADRIQVLFADERNELERLIREAVKSAARGETAAFAEQQGLGLPRLRPPPTAPAEAASMIATQPSPLAEPLRAGAPDEPRITARVAPPLAPASAAPTTVSARPPLSRRAIAPAVALAAAAAIAAVFAARHLTSESPPATDAKAAAARSAPAAAVPSSPRAVVAGPPSSAAVTSAARAVSSAQTATEPSAPTSAAASARSAGRDRVTQSNRTRRMAEPAPSVPPPPSARGSAAAPVPPSRPDDSYIRDLPAAPPTSLPRSPAAR